MLSLGASPWLGMPASIPFYIHNIHHNTPPSMFHREDGPEEGVTAAAQSTGSLETLLIYLPGCLLLAPAVYKPNPDSAFHGACDSSLQRG